MSKRLQAHVLLLLISLPVAASELSWSTFLGETTSLQNRSPVEQISSIAVISAGSVVVTGSTDATDFPVTAGAFQARPGGGLDAFVAKLLPDGSGLAWSTYLGGSGQDKGMKVAVDANGDVYVLGSTESSEFPSTRGERPLCPCWFIVKLNGATGSFQYSRLTQGSAADMAVGLDRGVYIAGSAEGDAFVVKLDAAGSVSWRKAFGGSNVDTATGIAVTPVGEAVVTGETDSSDFPTIYGAYQRTLGGNASVIVGSDVFITRLSSDGTAIVSSTLLGGWNRERGGRVALDESGNAYVTGNARDSVLPWTALPQFAQRDFLAKITPAGGLAWVVPIGDGGLMNALAVNAEGEAWVAGMNTGSYGLPTQDAIQTTVYRYLSIGFGDAALAGISSSGHGVAYGTYLGGTGMDYASTVAVDSSGHVYLAGAAWSEDFPTTAGAFQRNQGGRQFVAKIDIGAKPAVSLQAIVNAASYKGGRLVPGELITLFGDGFGPDLGLPAEAANGILPNSLGGTQVLVDGKPAPLLYVSRRQVNTIIPFAIGAMPEIVVCVTGGCSNPVRLTAAPQEIAFFSRNGTGAGQAAALNQDNTQNSPTNPAKKGSVLQLWATGGGATVPASQDGRVAPSDARTGLASPVQVQIGFVPVATEVLYAGAAPGMASGVVQINVRVPDNAPSGEVKLDFGNTTVAIE